MRRKYFDICHTRTFAGGFTLIELLVVISIISLLMAILLPTLGKARSLVKRIVCQSNLRQITLAWNLYLNDNEDVFYQGVNANHDFGGWKGTGGFGSNRPLNRYVGSNSNVSTEEGAKVFRCPTDSGGVVPDPSVTDKAYQYFGNSYQTNWFLVGPTQIGFNPPTLLPLHKAINTRLKGLKLSRVSTNPTLLVLLGDNNWVQEWLPVPVTSFTPHGKEWHGKVRHHNLAFLDGHVDFIRIRKGLYMTNEYRLVPFRNLNKLIRSVQEEIE